MPKKGDIALVAFPFSDMAGDKRRPAFVIGVSGDHVILLFITSRQHSRHSWHVPISATKHTGLHVASTIRCDKITSLDPRLITGKLGEAPPSVLKAVDTALKKLFRL